MLSLQFSWDYNLRWVSIVRDTATNYCLYSSGSKSVRLCQHTGMETTGLKSISKQRLSGRKNIVRKNLSKFFSTKRQQTQSGFSIWWNCDVEMKHAACNLPKWLGMEKFMYDHLHRLEEKISGWIMIIFPRTGIQNLLIANHKKGVGPEFITSSSQLSFFRRCVIKCNKMQF